MTLLHEEAGRLRAQVLDQELHTSPDQSVHVVLFGQVQEHQDVIGVNGSVVGVEEPDEMVRKYILLFTVHKGGEKEVGAFLRSLNQLNKPLDQCKRTNLLTEERPLQLPESAAIMQRGCRFRRASKNT